MKTIASAAFGLTLLAASAQAHAVLERKEAAPDASYRGVVVQVTDAFAPGAVVYVPVRQDRVRGGYGWSEIPAAGQDPHAQAAAAPGVRIAQAASGSASAAPVKAGDLAIETPWLRATPNGAKVAGGYVRITNTGGRPDRLTGASVPFAGRADIHSMAVEGGVMRMAPVAGGLTIRPGETVELKPGGYHLMFEDLTSGPKAGETVSGTLTFERAGTVPVSFSVAPVGASGPAVQHRH